MALRINAFTLSNKRSKYLLMVILVTIVLGKFKVAL